MGKYMEKTSASLIPYTFEEVNKCYKDTTMMDIKNDNF
ncbi:unnamed protein product [Spirodela intermedia]|uniref:Uncharacterized protein n=1 Tax=Spirodela intermedia TaxID=51605 RepID=A0A7I8JN25_SPIIN|nr:unnamed protein product [Spirodela intermedia]CAA6671211.1 unnamed protein product [Spirodela intermedia]